MIAWMRKVLTGADSARLYSVRPFRLLMIILCSLLTLTLTGCESINLGMLNPKGIIAFQERKLLFDTLALMLIVVLPVIVMSLTFVYHYQVSHRIRDYKPNWSHNYFLESIWWSVPCAIIVILAIITWKSTHELDPYNRIAGASEPPLQVQAIALPWKWLFIYPEFNIATVNYLEIPVGRQIEFRTTTDNVPMSAIFVPQLGSQIYAMAGMITRLHLLANQTGYFTGLDTQYNGPGFAEMHFVVRSVNLNEMKAWVSQVKASKSHLTQNEYRQLLKPTIGKQMALYSGVEPDLFMNVVTLYDHTFGPTHPRQGLYQMQGNSHA